MVKNNTKHFQAAVLILLFLKLSKLNTHIYKDHSEKPLFSHEAFFKIHTPLVPYFIKTMLLKISISNCNNNIYLHLCAPPFSLVSMKFGEIYLETWTSTQSYTAFWMLEFCSRFFVFLVAEHTQYKIPFPSEGQCLLSLVSSPSSWVINGDCLLSMCPEGHAPFPPLALSLRVTDAIILNHKRPE